MWRWVASHPAIPTTTTYHCYYWLHFRPTHDGMKGVCSINSQRIDTWKETFSLNLVFPLSTCSLSHLWSLRRVSFRESNSVNWTVSFNLLSPIPRASIEQRRDPKYLFSYFLIVCICLYSILYFIIIISTNRSKERNMTLTFNESLFQSFNFNKSIPARWNFPIFSN